jgi:O-acetylserine/cysteine efflux transporter
MARRDSLLAMLVAVLWGCNFVAIHLGMVDVPPFLFLAIRFIFVAFPLVFFVPKPQVSWAVIAGVGLFMSFGQFGLLYLGMSIGMPAGLAALVLQAQVMFTILIAWGVLGERASKRQIGGVVVGSVGLVVVAWGFGASAPIVPLVVTVAAAFSWAIGNVITRAAKVASGLSLVVWSALVVPIPCLAVSLLVDGPADMAAALGGFGWESWVSTTYTVVLSSLVGYSIFNSLIAKHSAASVVPYILLVPPVGLASAWIVLDEVPGGLELLGGAVMLVGVAIATISRRPGRRGPASARVPASPVR